jgi:cytochrome c oxidase subunit III
VVVGTAVPPVRRPSTLTVGTVVWLASEVTFFAGLFGAYFTLRNGAEGPWPPEGVELETVVAGAFTALLVLSSVTVQLGVRALEHGRRAAFQRWLLATVLLGSLFLANQAREWAAADFRADSHPYGSAFFVMTGAHGLHVLGGILAMAVLLGRSASATFDDREAPSAEVVSAYWHFVDVVWVLMFTTLFLVR